MAGFLGGAATRLKFRGRQPERTGVTNGGPVAKGGGADAQPRACQCGAGLVGPWAAGGHPRQHNDGGHAARKRQDLQRLRDRLEVVELRAAGDDDQVGDTSCFQRRVLGPGRRIDDDDVNVVRRGRGDGARQAGGLHSKHKWGFCGAAGAPLAGGRLGINVEHNGGPAGLFDSDGKGEGERGFLCTTERSRGRYCSRRRHRRSRRLSFASWSSHHAMRIRMIRLVLPAILAASQADHALAQERIDTSNFSAAAKAELSDGAQAVDILNRIDALLDPALVGFLDSKVRWFQVFLYDFFGDQLWPAPKGAEAFYREMQFYQEYHGTGSFTQRTFAPAGGSCELSVNTASGRFRADLEVCRELIELDMEITWWVETGARGTTSEIVDRIAAGRQMPPNEELLVLFPPPPITQEQLIKMLP